MGEENPQTTDVVRKRTVHWKKTCGCVGAKANFGRFFLDLEGNVTIGDMIVCAVCGTPWTKIKEEGIDDG